MTNVFRLRIFGCWPKTKIVKVLQIIMRVPQNIFLYHYSPLSWAALPWVAHICQQHTFFLSQRVLPHFYI